MGGGGSRHTRRSTHHRKLIPGSAAQRTPPRAQLGASRNTVAAIQADRNALLAPDCWEGLDATRLLSEPRGAHPAATCPQTRAQRAHAGVPFPSTCSAFTSPFPRRLRHPGPAASAQTGTSADKRPTCWGPGPRPRAEARRGDAGAQERSTGSEAGPGRGARQTVAPRTPRRKAGPEQAGTQHFRAHRPHT